ncbi:MAG: AEC family transporter [Zhengella sp.]|uniref:AEC family transporter n=1 Tax=Zhengella sp. TaxID=2282762 RepID=UPI001E1535E9|nr:AEC family transporter [Notoacmeibacter sp.]MCC0028455.1 AEC family transporter [Brucellaceae bacterium]
MNDSAVTILYVFGLVGLGWLSARFGVLRKGTGEGLADFAVTIAAPVLLFRTMAGADFSGSAPWLLWAVYFGAVALTWAAGHGTIRAVFGRDRRAGVVAGVSSAFSNLVLLGIPLILSLLGQSGFETLSLIIAVHLPVMMSASIILFEWASRDSGTVNMRDVVRTFLRRLFVNPLILGILAGLAWRLTGLDMPAPLPRMVDALAGVAGPVALFAMGMSLNDFGLAGNLRAAAALAGLKLFLMPAIALGLAWVAGLPAPVAEVAVMAAALPAGVNSYLIATRFGTGQALAASAMTLGTATALFSTAVWIMLARAVFG